MIDSESEDEVEAAVGEPDQMSEDELDLLHAGMAEVFSPDTNELSFTAAFEHVFKASASASEPRSFAEAMRQPDADEWFKAASEEIQSLMDNGTWELVKLPPGRRAIGSRWVFKVKHNADGSVERYKGRLVAKGFSQRPGFEFSETFAPTAKWAALRAILALAALEDLELESVDISSAFLNGDLDTDVYMQQPEGFEKRGPDYVCRLLKSLYGLKQAGRMWYIKLDKILTEIGFTRVLCDHSIWVWNKAGVRIIVPVFVDDLTIASTSKESIQQVKDDLRKHFKLRDLGPTSFLLGVEVTRDRSTHTLTLSQRQYILDMLERYSFSNSGTVSTPMDPGVRLSASMAPQTPEDIEYMKSVPYINAVGSLMYLAVSTRPDIAYSVGVLCRFNANPGVAHWKAVKHLFRYLQGTLDVKLTYSPSSSPELFTSYTDADHGGNPDNGRSTTGFVIKMGTGAVSWGSKLQSLVALSTTEAEYIAACTTGQEILWLRNLFTELGYPIGIPSTLHIDNQSALAVAKNPEHHGRMKHLDLRFYWLRDAVAEGHIGLVHLSTAKMPADILTKPLGRLKVESCREMLGLQL
jgi:hypothetical protein